MRGLQLLQHKTYAGVGEVVDDTWKIKSKMPDGRTHVQCLSARWLDVATGCAVQPAKGSFDAASQLLPIGNAEAATLTLDHHDEYNCSEDEWKDADLEDDDEYTYRPGCRRYHDERDEYEEEPRDSRHAL